MEKNRFLKTQAKRNSVNHHYTSTASKVSLYGGILIIMCALIYMIVNLSEADMFITTWLLFMAIGVVSVIWSVVITLIKRQQKESCV